jgi:hypothetical protein
VNGLLQRLVGPALVRTARSSLPGIRPAAVIHAQASLAISGDAPEISSPRPLVDADTASTGLEHRVREPQSMPRTMERIVSPDVKQTIPTSSELTARAKTAVRETAAPPLASPMIPHAEATASPPERVPQPLLDAAVINIVTPQRITPLSPMNAAAPGGSQQRTEPTEVHVHIGRIEVIATQEPTAPKKSRTSAARSTLPLAEYLARRRSS